MKNLLLKLKNPKLHDGFQVTYLLSIVLYLAMLSDGGLFTTYYAMHLCTLIGALAGILSFLQKRPMLAIATLLSAGAVFIQFVTMAP